MHTCCVCDKKYEDKYFDISQSKCILHCEKDDWYEVEHEKKDWLSSSDKIELFWQHVRTLIKNRSEDEDYKRGASVDFSKTIFPKFEEKFVDEEVFDDDSPPYVTYWHDNFCDLNIVQSEVPECKLNARLDLSNSIFLDDVNFDYYEFEDHVSFNGVQFKGECSFRRMIFSGVSFNRVNFFKSVLFENAQINLFSYITGDFQDSIFHDVVKFTNTAFGNENNKKHFDIDFRGTEFKKVHFLSCIFHTGLRLYKDTQMDSLDLQNLDLNELYIAGDMKHIHIRGNKREIGKLTIKHKNLETLLIQNCIVKSDFLLNDKVWQKDKVFKLKKLQLSESTFEGKVKIQFYEIIGKANFYNTKFKDLADFYKTEFNEVVFERTDFEKVSVFSEAIFNQDVDFKYTKFLGKSIFRDMVIKNKLNLRDTIFDNDATFLDITSEQRIKDHKTQEYYGEPKIIQVANRETARIIKNFYDNSNNIIEANKFYALEMKQMEKELNLHSAPLQWLVFKLHSVSSDHSQSWFLALFWIFYLTFMFSFVDNVFNTTDMIMSFIITAIYIEFSLIIGLFFDSIDNIYRSLFSIPIVIISYVIYGIKTDDFALACFSENINPFSIMTSADNMTFGILIFKVAIAYLIYQFIISVRQNTRRK